MARAGSITRSCATRAAGPAAGAGGKPARLPVHRCAADAARLPTGREQPAALRRELGSSRGASGARVRNNYTELTATFEEKLRLKRRMTSSSACSITASASATNSRSQPNLTTARIAEEVTQFQIAETGEAIWSPAFESNREEYLYNRTPISGITTAQTPMTMKHGERAAPIASTKRRWSTIRA